MSPQRAAMPLIPFTKEAVTGSLQRQGLSEVDKEFRPDWGN